MCVLPFKGPVKVEQFCSFVGRVFAPPFSIHPSSILLYENRLYVTSLDRPALSPTAAKGRGATGKDREKESYANRLLTQPTMPRPIQPSTTAPGAGMAPTYKWSVVAKLYPSGPVIVIFVIGELEMKPVKASQFDESSYEKVPPLVRVIAI